MINTVGHFAFQPPRLVGVVDDGNVRAPHIEQVSIGNVARRGRQDGLEVVDQSELPGPDEQVHLQRQFAEVLSRDTARK